MVTSPNVMSAENCNEKVINPEINVNINPLKVDWERSVNYLRLTSISEGHNPIGMYTGTKEIKIAPTYTINKRLFGSGVCAQLNTIKINIDVSPVIYISTEAQQYACTKKRVYEHEIMHYNIDIKAINKASDYLKNQVRQNYTSALIVANNTEINEKMGELNNLIIKAVFEYIRNESSPFHEKLDTTENYKKESTYCSDMENIALTELITGIK